MLRKLIKAKCLISGKYFVFVLRTTDGITRIFDYEVLSKAEAYQIESNTVFADFTTVEKCPVCHSEKIMGCLCGYEKYHCNSLTAINHYCMFCKNVSLIYDDLDYESFNSNLIQGQNCVLKAFDSHELKNLSIEIHYEFGKSIRPKQLFLKLFNEIGDNNEEIKLASEMNEGVLTGFKSLIGHREGQISFNLSLMPYFEKYSSLTFLLDSNSKELKLTLNDFSNISLKIYDKYDLKELVSYDLKGNYDNDDLIIVGSLYHEENELRFLAKGISLLANDKTKLLNYVRKKKR